MGAGRATHIGLDDDPIYFGCICCRIRTDGKVRVVTFKNLSTDRENCARRIRGHKARIDATWRRSESACW